MSILQNSGFCLKWLPHGPRHSREACPHEGGDRRTCGLLWCPLPGVPRGRVEVRPVYPHQRNTEWEYTIFAPPAAPIVGRGIRGLMETQHNLLHRVPDVLAKRRWVTARIAVVDGSWTVTLAYGSKEKVLQGGPEKSGTLLLLGAARAIFEALKQPSKVAIFESTGLLRELYDGGYWPGKGDYGNLMHEVDTLSEQHYVMVTTKQ